MTVRNGMVVVGSLIVVAGILSALTRRELPLEAAKRVTECVFVRDESCLFKYVATQERKATKADAGKLAKFMAVCFADGGVVQPSAKTVIEDESSSASMATQYVADGLAESSLNITVAKTEEGPRVNGLVVSIFVSTAVAHRPMGTPLPKGIDREKALIAFLTKARPKLEASGILGIWSYNADGELFMTWAQYETFLRERVRRFTEQATGP